MSDLADRVRRLEDRQEIIDVIVRYCVAVDARDWSMFADCFAPRVLRDTGEVSREEFVSIVEGALPGFAWTQHVSTNHLVTFDAADPDGATCDSDMVATHELAGSPHGTSYVLRARYRDRMVRTASGWRIRAITTTNRREEGNLDAVAEAAAVVASRSS